MCVVLECNCHSEAKLRHDLHNISTTTYYGRQIVVVVEREWSKPAENHPTLITNRLQETLFLAQNNENIKIFWSAPPIDLDKWPFCYLTFFASSSHHPASLHKEGSICEEEILRYSIRTELLSRSYRLADLWPFASKSNTHLLFTVYVLNME